MTTQRTLSELLIDRIPLFAFGSEGLDALHAAAKEPPFLAGYKADGWRWNHSMGAGPGWEARSIYANFRQEYGWSHHEMQYIVDHGGFYVLQTIFSGQVVPVSEHLVNDRPDLSLIRAARDRAAVETEHNQRVALRRAAQGGML